jgi:exonuclease III
MADQSPTAAIAVAAAAEATLKPAIDIEVLKTSLGLDNIEAINTLFKNNYKKKLRLNAYQPLGLNVTKEKVKEEFLDNQKKKQVLELLYTEAGRLTLEDIDDAAKEKVSIISIINIDDGEYYIIPTPICLLYYIIKDLENYLKDIVCDIDVGELEPISTKPTLEGIIVEDKNEQGDNELYETLPLKCRFKLKNGGCELIIKEKEDITINFSEHIKYSLKASSFNEIKEEIDDQIDDQIVEANAASSHTTSRLSPPLQPPLQPPLPSSILKLISWNIIFNIRKPKVGREANAAEKKIEKIIAFLKAQKPVIFFTQESVLTKPEINQINTNYYRIIWNTKNSGISINYNKEIFEIASDICRLGIKESRRDVRPKTYGKSKRTTNKKMNVNDTGDTNTNRPIICVKLEEKKTKTIIVFITLHAPHHIYKNKDILFINSLNECLEKVGHTKGERIIIAGDFNEYYKEGDTNVDTIKLKLGGTGTEIPLYLKQTKNTCCGSTDITKDELADDPSTKRFDLVYDSTNKEKNATVYDGQRTSDHKPISYDFSI